VAWENTWFQDLWIYLSACMEPNTLKRLIHNCRKQCNTSAVRDSNRYAIMHIWTHLGSLNTSHMNTVGSSLYIIPVKVLVRVTMVCQHRWFKIQVMIKLLFMM
jgi:hypothetical protein